GRRSTKERRKDQSLDQSLIKKPYSEVAHFSVEKPAQFRVEINTVALFRRLAEKLQSNSAYPR
ncbi:hypothetical protein, partial [Rhizobium halophytocola]|uniref:hypothetical protein n=1 Tax=Rhizobium halophytocola TaxID=735519 RepID=UPI0036150458